MPYPRKTDTYEAVLKHLERHPIKKWACAMAGISRQCLYERINKDPEYAVRVRQAMAIGQGKLIPHASPERVLSWSDPETFSLRRDHKVERSGRFTLVVGEQWGVEADKG